MLALPAHSVVAVSGEISGDAVKEGFRVDDVTPLKYSWPNVCN
jgi:hypothetical protein